MPSTTWSIRLVVEEYARIEPEIGSFFADVGVVGRPAFVAQMVIEEVVRNLIEHTPGEADATDEDATIGIVVSAEDVTVTIDDDRPPFSPLDGPALDVEAPLEQRRAGGMGLHLVRTMTDSLSYERVDGRNRLIAVVRR
jgi:serine/threonine-protein kinase RsbW